jgi:hypothetical protein
MEAPHSHGVGGAYFPSHPANIFTLSAAGNQHIFTISADGSIQVSPQFTIEQAAKEFWKWIESSNLIQIAVQNAVEHAKREERASIVEQIEKQGKQWGITRSMKMTNYSDAAEDLVDLIRK